MENMLLIGGDFSGIQGYIYNIASKYASENLKGRSEKLKEECEKSAKTISDKVKGEVIVSSGGTFLILADDSSQNREVLDQAIADIERSIYSKYGTDLYVAIDHVDLSAVGSYWEASTALFKKRDEKKNRKLAALIKDNYADFFEPQQWHYDETDAITGAYFKSPEEKKRCDGIEGYVTQQTLDQIIRGDDLAKESNRVRNFNKLIDSQSSLKRLGVLRMDVDNLGMAFQEEIKKCQHDLEQYKSLSQHFTEFFDEQNLYRITDNGVFIVYSGGDDIFAVGQWDETIAFAEAVRTEFAKQEFVKSRKLSISGGVAIIKAKYPIMKGADEGGELEDLAKAHKVGAAEKDSLAFLGMALNWDKEYPVVKALKKDLVELEKHDMLDSSFRSKVLKHYANSEIKEERHKIKNLKTYWMLTYDLGRMKQRYKNSPEVAEMINNCIVEVCENKKQLNGKSIETDYHALELWAMACRWAELELRTNN